MKILPRKFVPALTPVHTLQIFSVSHVVTCYHGTGYVGIVRDAIEITARIELHTTCTMLIIILWNVYILLLYVHTYQHTLEYRKQGKFAGLNFCAFRKSTVKVFCEYMQALYNGIKSCKRKAPRKFSCPLARIFESLASKSFHVYGISFSVI